MFAPLLPGWLGAIAISGVPRGLLARRRFLGAGAIAAALTLANPFAVRSVSEEEIDAANEERERVEQEARDAEAMLLAAKARESTLQQQLAAIDRDRYNAVERLRTVQRELETVELEVYDINLSIGRLNERLSRETQRLENRARSLYKLGRVGVLETVLSANSFSDALDRVGTVQRALAQDVADIDRLRLSRREIQLRTGDLSGRLDRMESLRSEATTIQEELAARADEQSDLIFGVRREQAEVEDQIHAFEAESAAIGRHIAVLREIRERELAELERRRRILELQRQARDFARRVAEEQGSSVAGSYVWPLIGLITTEYGGCTFGQCPHIGIDIAASLGAPIVAANDGVVLAVGLVVPGDRRASYGNIAIIAHSDSEETLYAHLDDFTWPPPIKAGQFVARGQTIGYVGLTGWTTGPHLHFEYRVDGVPVNPRSVFP